jgi:hypothetical protein
MKTGPIRDAQQTKKCVYNIPRECDRCYIGETSRPVEVRIKEYKYHFGGSLVTTAWRVLRLRMEETPSRYGG